MNVCHVEKDKTNFCVTDHSTCVGMLNIRFEVNADKVE